MAASKLMIVFVVMAIASFRLPSSVAQSTRRHVVGDNTGWRIPDESTFYANWASGKNFIVGDTLVFNFAKDAHDVAEVRESAFGPCNTTDFITRNTTGPVTTTLTTAGNHYYICTIGAGAHCQAGQKLNISVAEATGSTPNSTTPAPTNGTMSPPPPSPSSSSSFTAIVPVTFLAAALAFFY